MRREQARLGGPAHDAPDSGHYLLLHLAVPVPRGEKQDQVLDDGLLAQDELPQFAGGERRKKFLQELERLDDNVVAGLRQEGLSHTDHHLADV